jgi:hypothetical protein
MDMLVVYYSRTGTNRQVAEYLGDKLQVPIDEIVDKKKRTGALGFMKAGYDAKQQKTTDIEIHHDPAEFEYLVLGTPKWAWAIPPAIRAYLTRYSLAGKKNRVIQCLWKW